MGGEGRVTWSEYPSPFSSPSPPLTSPEAGPGQDLPYPKKEPEQDLSYPKPWPGQDLPSSKKGPEQDLPYRPGRTRTGPTLPPRRDQDRAYTPTLLTEGQIGLKILHTWYYLPGGGGVCAEGKRWGRQHRVSGKLHKKKEIRPKRTPFLL